MTTLRNRNGEVLVVNPRNPDLLTVIPDPTGTLGEIIKICAARDQRRRKENR